jgi:hypothetical protein
MAKLGIERPTFTVDAIRQAAEKESGHRDFGSDSYLPGLEALLYSIEHESQLHFLGRMAIFRQIVAALANRLTVVAWEKANPDLAAAEIRAPLIVLGLGRTGTTILQETLASAPGMRTPLQWEITNYSLVGTVVDPKTDKRIERIQTDIDRTDKIVPGFSAIHYYDAFTPSECIGLTALDMCSEQFSAMAWAPTYRDFLLSHDHRSVYHWHRRALCYLQASTPTVQWVIKAPTHSAYLDAILSMYPDAMIINTHRDPTEVVGSMCSLFATLRRGFSDHVDAVHQGRRDAAYAAQIIQRAVDFRRGHAEVELQFCDIAFKKFVTDGEGTLATIYAHFGLDFTAEARAAMLDYLAGRPREKYGTHRYDLAQSGLSIEALAPLFAEYTHRFGAYF